MDMMIKEETEKVDDTGVGEVGEVGGNGSYGMLSVASAPTPGLVPKATMFDGGLNVEELMRVEDEGWLEMGDAGEVAWDNEEEWEDTEEEALDEALPVQEFQDYDDDSGIVPVDIIAPVDVMDEPVKEVVVLAALASLHT